MKRSKIKLSSFDDLKEFISLNNIKTRNELKKFTKALNLFRSLSDSDKNILLPFRGIDYSLTMDYNYFKEFIHNNNILSRKDFKKRFNGIFKKFKSNLSKEEQDKLLPKLFKDSTFLNSFKSFRDYIKNNNIHSRWDLSRREYKLFISKLSKEEQELLLPKVVNDYSSINSFEEFQKFVDDNLIVSSQDFRKRFVGLYEKFRKLTINNKEVREKIKFYNVEGTRKHSYGENYIINILKKNNIKFITEKTYPDLKDKGFFRYDFYIQDYNLLIEYHGEQHFKTHNDFFLNAKETVYRDKQKYEYAIKNKINILYFTLDKNIYEKYGYFTEVITDPDILINKIKEIGLTNQSSNTNN